LPRDARGRPDRRQTSKLVEERVEDVLKVSGGLGIRTGRLLSMEEGTATDEDKTFYRTWLSRIEGWSAGERHHQLEGASAGRESVR
jgi:hypothetical protein